MPRLTRWFIKTALIYLVLSLLLSVLVVTGATIPALQPLAVLSPLYLQLLMIGWISQLIFGIANWMFPIYTREAPRRNTNLGWLTYILLNCGLIILLVSELFLVLENVHIAPSLGGLASILLFIAAVTFVLNIWARVKGH